MNDIKIKTNIYVNIDGIIAFYNVTTYKELNSVNYFSDLVPNIPFIEALKDYALNNLVKIYLVVPYFPTMKNCLTERKEWINENIPFALKKHIIYVPVGQKLYESINIEQFVSSDKLYLIDDYIPNLKRWEKKNENMKGILYLNNDIKFNSEKTEINNNWKDKYYLEHSTDKNMIYTQLKKILK